MFTSREIFSSADVWRLARKRLPWMVYDYIDGAAGEETGKAINRKAIQNLRLQPRILVNVTKRDIGVDVFNHQARVPFGVSPMGMCNLSTPGADLLLARKAAEFKTPVGVSTVASTSLEKMIEVADGHAWFQLYFSGDGSGTRKLIERAAISGYETLVFTLDVPEVGRRPRELRRGFKMPFKIGLSQFIDFALHPRWSISTLLNGRPKMANFTDPGNSFDRTESRAAANWDDLKRIRDDWKGKLVIKGVLSCEDAVRIKDEGVDAIQVSSHGGRQLDSAPPPIQALRDIRYALGESFPIFYDSGLRSGEDIIKAYAMGADFVFFGRAMLLAMAANGEKGLTQFWNVLSNETSLTLAQIGRTSMNKLGETLVTN
ncbi:MAG: alpha-hydroxy-acid oxidizing protein [bacterium]|nr:alpha-hydroxy-acid oxidizing protein [bacterium]